MSSTGARSREQIHKHHEVIVIGAGLSGMTAATRLNDRGIDVVVLEASNRVGGRILTVQNSNAGYADLGGTLIHTSHKNMWKELEKYHLKTYPANFKGYCLCFRDGKSIRYDKSPEFPSKSDRDDYYRLATKMNSLMQKVEKNESSGEALDRVTFQAWIDENIDSELVKANIKMLCRLDFCAEPSDVSLLWALYAFDAAGGLEAMNNIDKVIPEHICIGGVQQLPKAMGQDLEGRVLLGEIVEHIQSSASTLTVTTANGNRYQASRVIMAIPPVAQQRITLDPQPSVPRRRLIQNVPMGSVIKIFLFYERAYWKEQGLSGYVTCEADNYPVCAAMDYTKPDGSYPSIVGIVASRQAVEMSKLTKDERRERVAAQYATLFNIPEMENPIHYEEYDWTSDVWAQGGYAGIMTPGNMTDLSETLSKPEGLIHYAGTEAAGSESEGYMDGAIEAGNRAAIEVLRGLQREEG